jgi:hypothetical protein
MPSARTSFFLIVLSLHSVSHAQAKGRWRPIALDVHVANLVVDGDSIFVERFVDQDFRRFGDTDQAHRLSRLPLEGGRWIDLATRQRGPWVVRGDVVVFARFDSISQHTLMRVDRSGHGATELGHFDPPIEQLRIDGDVVWLVQQHGRYTGPMLWRISLAEGTSQKSYALGELIAPVPGGLAVCPDIAPERNPGFISVERPGRKAEHLSLKGTGSLSELRAASDGALFWFFDGKLETTDAHLQSVRELYVAPAGVHLLQIAGINDRWVYVATSRALLRVPRASGSAEVLLDKEVRASLGSSGRLYVAHDGLIELLEPD